MGTGFAVRADRSRPMEVDYFEGAVAQEVAWIKKLLDSNKQ